MSIYKIVVKGYRFLAIDLQYLMINSISLNQKLKDVFLTDFKIFQNIVFRKKNFKAVNLHNSKIKYDTVFATKSFLVGLYDFYNESKRASIFQKEPVIIDVGANIGQYLYSIKSLIPKAKVYSIEASPDAFKILNDNSKNFKNVNCFNVALSDKKGTTKFFINKKFSTWSTLETTENKADYDEISINTVRGDSLFSNIKQIDLLKIDVEGAELKVLKGMIKTLRKSKYLMVEVSLTRDIHDYGSNKLLKFILENDFQMIHIGRIFSEGLGKNQSAANILFKKN